MVHCRWYHDCVRWTHIAPHDSLSFGFPNCKRTGKVWVFTKQAVTQRRNDESANFISCPRTRFSNARLQSASQHSRHRDSNTGSTSLSNSDSATSHQFTHANTITNQHASAHINFHTNSSGRLAKGSQCKLPGRSRHGMGANQRPGRWSEFADHRQKL